MKARIQMIGSMAMFGTLSLFVRNIALTSAEVALFRATIALLALSAWRALRGGGAHGEKLGGEWPLLFLSGAAMGFNWILLFEAYRWTTVSAATLSYYFAPVIVMAACPLLFHERVTRRQALCFVGSTVGMVLVIDPGGLTGGGTHLKGVAFGLAAAALYASVILLNKRIRRVSGIDRTIWQFAAAAIVLLPYVLLTTGIHLSGMTAAGWLCLLCVGLLHSGAAYVAYFSALAALPGQESAILSYIDPMVAVMISLVILREPVTLAQIVGGAMILGFTLAFELQ